jgi:hypothetical protein
MPLNCEANQSKAGKSKPATKHITNIINGVETMRFNDIKIDRKSRDKKVSWIFNGRKFELSISCNVTLDEHGEPEYWAVVDYLIDGQSWHYNNNNRETVKKALRLYERVVTEKDAQEIHRNVERQSKLREIETFLSSNQGLSI